MVIYSALRPTVHYAAASRNGGQGTVALDGFIGTHIEFSLESVLLRLRLARWSQATVKLEGLCIAQGEALHVACFAATTLDG